MTSIDVRGVFWILRGLRYVLCVRCANRFFHAEKLFEEGGEQNEGEIRLYFFPYS